MSNSLTPLVEPLINVLEDVRFDKYAFTSAFAKDFMPDGSLTGTLPALVGVETLTGFTPSMYQTSGTDTDVSGRYYSVANIYEAKGNIKYSGGVVAGGRLSDFEAKMIKSRVKECLDAVESGFAVEAKGQLTRPGIPSYVGTAATTPFATPFDDLVNANEALNRNHAPEDNRHVICDLAAWGNMLNNTGLFRADAGGPEGVAAISQGFIPTRMGFDVKWNHKMATISGHVGNTGSGALFISTGSKYADSGTIYFSGTGATTLRTGTVVYLGGAGSNPGQSYVLTTGAALTDSGTGNSASIPLWPALRTGITELTGVTLTSSGDYVGNVAFHRDAFRIVMRDPLKSMQGREVQGTHYTYVDPTTGVPLLISWYPGDLMGNWAVKVLFQWVAEQPDWACWIAG